MMALVTEFLPYIIAGVTAIAGVLGVYFKGKSAGKRDAEHEQMERRKKAREGARKVQEDVRQKPPDQQRKELKDKWSR